MSKEKKSTILILFSLLAMYFYQFVVGILVLALAIHTLLKE